jgi:hypothetical protein
MLTLNGQHYTQWLQFAAGTKLYLAKWANTEKKLVAQLVDLGIQLSQLGRHIY